MSPGPLPRSWTPTRTPSPSCTQPAPASPARGSSSTPSTPRQKRSARSASSAGNSIRASGHRLSIGARRLAEAAVAAEEGALGADQLLELAAVEEDPVAFRALLDRHPVALVGAHRRLALGTGQCRPRFEKLPTRRRRPGRLLGCGGVSEPGRSAGSEQGADSPARLRLHPARRPLAAGRAGHRPARGPRGADRAPRLRRPRRLPARDLRRDRAALPATQPHARLARPSWPASSSTSSPGRPPRFPSSPPSWSSSPSPGRCHRNRRGCASRNRRPRSSSCCWSAT